MHKLIGLLLLVTLLSCEKKELPAPKKDRGNVITQQIELTANYKNQVWFRLSDNTIVLTNNKTDWDLGFESSAIAYHVILNGAMGMKTYKTNFTTLNQVTDTNGLAINALADMPNGDLDSTAIGNWQASNTVYIINRGYNELGQQQGFYKLKINSASATQYTIQYGDVFGSTIYSNTITKNTDYTFNMYSLNNHQQLIIEPKKTDYDVCFTQYTHAYYQPLHFYQVTGLLNNSYNTKIIKITDKAFNNITINDTISRIFSTHKNTIGFDWKTFDLNTNIFTVNSKINYIITDSKHIYYKLHFIDFYNEAGIKGYPKFEFVRL